MINEKIISAAGRLTKLLADPQPGLFTWHIACELVYQELIDECVAERQPEPKKE